MNGPLYYSWQGTPVEVEPIGEGWEGGLDVSYETPEHPTGTVPADETHYIVRLIGGGGRDAWWASEAALQKFATPIGPGALEREGEWSDDMEIDP